MNLSETESHDLKELEDKRLIMTAQNASRKELKVDVREQILMLRSIFDFNGKPMSIRKIVKTVGCSLSSTLSDRL